MARPASVSRRLIALAVSLAVRALDLIADRVRQYSKRPIARCGVVLYYHAVKPGQRHRFARQMDELRRRATVFEAHRLEGMGTGRRNVAVTFDDGFRSVVENALPELAERHIPCVIFVPSGCLGQRPCWVCEPTHASWEERVISASEIAVIATAPLVTIGSHSVTHRNLLDLDPDLAEQELVRSKVDLEAATGANVELFSFPYGAFNAALLELARQAGYRRAFTVEPVTVDADPSVFTVGRVAVDPDDWPVEFRLKLGGAYRWRQYLHRLRGRRRP